MAMQSTVMYAYDPKSFECDAIPAGYHWCSVAYDAAVAQDKYRYHRRKCDAIRFAELHSPDNWRVEHWEYGRKYGVGSWWTVTGNYVK